MPTSLIGADMAALPLAALHLFKPDIMIMLSGLPRTRPSV
jgi:hypothetical protein